MVDNIGERIASLNAEFKSFRTEVLKDNDYIKGKVDKIVEALPEKVDRQYCQERREKLHERVTEVEKNGRRDELLKRIRALEQKTPAIIQSVVLAIMTAVLTAAAVKVWMP